MEVKSFVGASDLRDFEEAIGQYVFYRALLARLEPDRKLLLAVPDGAYRNTFTRAMTRIVLETADISVISFDVAAKEVTRWEA